MKSKEELAAYKKQWVKDNRERVNETARKGRENNPSIHKAAVKKWRDKNTDKIKTLSLSANKTYRDKHAEEIKDRLEKYKRDYQDKIKSAQKKWASNNPEKISVMCAKRRAVKKQSIPSWYDSQSVKDVYLEAQYFGMEVDHIVPLQSDKVCGLHCFDNLQLLPRIDNIIKGNRVWPDMP